MLQSSFCSLGKDKMVAILTLHVADGLFCGDCESLTYKKTELAIDNSSNIKKWSVLGEQEEDYLSMQWQQFGGSDPHSEVNMDRYIDKLVLIDVPADALDTQPLSDSQHHDFLSGLEQVRWPVNHLLPSKAYEVSSVAQHGRDELKVLHLRELNTIIRGVLKAKKHGDARVFIRPADLKNPLVMTSFDSSFAREKGMKSQTGFISYITSVKVMQGPQVCGMVEFQSSTIQLVVKSTMAAESVGVSIALDRQLYHVVP